MAPQCPTHTTTEGPEPCLCLQLRAEKVKNVRLLQIAHDVVTAYRDGDECGLKLEIGLLAGELDRPVGRHTPAAVRYGD